MNAIVFKKKVLGKWIRDDNESKKYVNEESMFREITKLIHDGWVVRIYGFTHARKIVLTKPKKRET